MIMLLIFKTCYLEDKMPFLFPQTLAKIYMYVFCLSLSLLIKNNTCNDEMFGGCSYTCKKSCVILLLVIFHF